MLRKSSLVLSAKLNRLALSAKTNLGVSSVGNTTVFLLLFRLSLAPGWRAWWWGDNMLLFSAKEKAGRVAAIDSFWSRCKREEVNKLMVSGFIQIITIIII